MTKSKSLLFCPVTYIGQVSLTRSFHSLSCTIKKTLNYQLYGKKYKFLFLQPPRTSFSDLIMNIYTQT